MKQVKICGLTDESAFDAVIDAHADYAGFMFYPNSPRYITSEMAAILANRPLGYTKLVGVFVAPDLDEVDAVLQDVPLDILQIYGAAEQLPVLRRRFGRPVWRQLGVSNAAEFPASDEQSDGFIIEAKPPVGATRPGGNGIQADWTLLAGFKPAQPWLLAGGLNPGNVVEALQRTGATGADVSSGVETSPGVKSPDLIKAFIKAVRSA